MRFTRHELKYYVNDFAMEGLISKLSQLMDLDANTQSTGYRVRSLYFDSHDDECLFEKQSGFYDRKKIRLRTYGNDNSQTVKLEIKRKKGPLVRKDSATISRNLAENLIQGNYRPLLEGGHPVLDEVFATFQRGAYAPKVIVEYVRTAFTMPVSNIRITFDTELASNLNQVDLFASDRGLMPVILEGKQILEVKFDDFFPGYLKRLVSSASTERMAISKYALARRYFKKNKWEDN